jgi:recombination DNA repair RAD52 pathway protein
MGKILKAAAPLTLYEKSEKNSRYDIIMTEQVLHMMQKTPAEHIYQRKGKGGQTWDYVTGTYVKKTLNYVFGWNWDFTVVAHGVEGNQIWVHGRLTVRVPWKKGEFQSIVKEQFGRADVKQLKTGGNVDFGNDLKAATTDALKKCASELGIASDIYGKEEFKEIKTVDISDIPAPEPSAALKKTDSKPKVQEAIVVPAPTPVAEQKPLTLGAKDPAEIRGALLHEEGKL